MASQQVSQDSFDDPVPGATLWPIPEDIDYDSDDSFDAPVVGARPPPQVADVTPNLHYPTADEIDYLKKYTTITTVSPPAKLNSMVVHCGNSAFRLKDLDVTPDSLVQHMEKLLDIFIRTMYQRNGTDLREDKYWLSLDNYGSGLKTFHVKHQPYIQATGHHLMNRVAAATQFNKELSLNDAIEIEMFIFKMTAKGTQS